MGRKHLRQSFFVVVVEPIDPCLHAFLLSGINRIAAAARDSTLFLCRDRRESGPERVARRQEEGEHHQDRRDAE